MTPGVDQLRDIHGLDPLSWWPPALGWWLVLLGALLLAVGVRYAWHWWRRRVSMNWRRDAWRRLQALRDRLQWGDARTVASDLSELMRRIAIARVGRRACAGLVDHEWLAWLEEHDPQRFPWTEQGQLLVQLPYAPPGGRKGAAELAPLVAAAEEWTKVEDEPDAVELRWQRLMDRWKSRRKARPAGAAEGAHV